MFFENKWNQLALLLLLFGINTFLFSLLAGFTADLLFGTEALASAPALRYINSLTQVGVFGLTAYLFAHFVNNQKPATYLQTNKGLTLTQCLLLILIFLVSSPALSSIIEWNASIQFPDFMSSIESWMRQQEDKSATTTTTLLAGKGIAILLINLFTMALIPAICEELLFRGAVLGWLRHSLKNIHLAVFLSAIIFSAFHVQFFGFVPRLLLGLYLGYILLWSGSMWSCIMAHFINNSMMVTAAYLYNNHIIDVNQSHLGSAGGNYTLIILSVVLTTFFLYLFYKKRNQDDKPKLQQEYPEEN